MDAADGHDRHIHGVADLFQSALRQDIYIGFGVGGKCRADAQIIRAVGHGQLCFLDGMGRHTDDHVRADLGADVCGSHIFLPDVDAVGMAFYSDLDVIVDDEGYAIAAAEGRKLHGFLQKCRVVQLLFPQLDAGDAAFQRVFHLLAEGLSARPRPVGDGVEKHGVFIAFHSVLLPRAVRGSCCRSRR